MKIFLCGYMGAGKTLVGKILSKALKIDFSDLDKAIEQSEDKKVEQIFSTKGEIYFRKQEMTILKDFLISEKSFVLALGGGTPCYGNNLQLIKEAQDVKLVYLKSSPEKLTERLFFETEKRPLINHLKTKEELLDYIRKHLFERNFYYNQSDFIINTDALNPEEVAAQIIDFLN